MDLADPGVLGLPLAEAKHRQPSRELRYRSVSTSIVVAHEWKLAPCCPAL
jgi:hypothetical protein